MSLSRRRIISERKILLGACHVIYVRLTAIHRTVSTRCFVTNIDVVERPVTMTTTLQKQAWQSGLLLSEKTPEWNEDDWPLLYGGWRLFHASVGLDHPDEDDNNNNKGQTVVVLGGFQQGQGHVKSVLVLYLADPDKQWREGPPMNQKRAGHGAVVCNGAVYVMGGSNAGSSFDCIERIGSTDLLQPSSTSSITRKSSWVTLTCRLSTGRCGCCAVVVHNRYIVVMGGWNRGTLWSVDIIDTNNHTVIAGPSMTVPRQLCVSAVIGNRIFVVGGCNEDGNLDSVEYLDFARPCDHEKTNKDTATTLIPFSSTWITHSHLVLSNARSSCAVVAMGSCLVVAGGRGNSTVEVLDTHRNRVWNLSLLGNGREGCSLVTIANQITMIGGCENRTSATFSLVDKHTWCFRRLCG